ncbi:MAG: cytochrome c [Acidobacteria bacterium]|nr:cytochrome c [Acidobacteriota bacterium]
MFKELPRWLKLALVASVVLSWVPLALVARARFATSTKPRLHVVFDMDNQPRFKAQQVNPLFADGREARPPVPGTVPFSPVAPDPVVETGKRAGEWVAAVPLKVDLALVRRGKDRYHIYCEPCHGVAGYGDGPVAKRADQLQEGTWTQPASFHTDLVRGRPPGQLFNTVTNGIRNMPPYGPQIPVRDRWAIVTYIRALQLSRNARLEDVPPELVSKLQ